MNIEKHPQKQNESKVLEGEVEFIEFNDALGNDSIGNQASAIPTEEELQQLKEISQNTENNDKLEMVENETDMSAELQELKSVGIEIIEEESNSSEKQEDLEPEDFPFLNSK